MKKIEITKKEAEVLLFALGNSTDDDDAMLTMFPKKRDREICLRAEAKIMKAFSGKVYIPTRSQKYL